MNPKKDSARCFSEARKCGMKVFTFTKSGSRRWCISSSPASVVLAIRGASKVKAATPEEITGLIAARNAKIDAASFNL